MICLARTARPHFLGLVAGFLAWILIMAAAGLNEWRLWHVADVSVITSGVAWVGIWRACFYSHVLPETESCRGIGISDQFAPAEIPVAQVLMMLAVVFGLAGNISAASAMRMVYFPVEDRKSIQLLFVLAGTLYTLTAVFCLVPVVWNMSSVLNNSTIDFPPDFHLPAPVRQRVGSAIGVGLFASILMLISGTLFLCCQYDWRGLSSAEPPRDIRDPLHGPRTQAPLAQTSGVPNRDNRGMDNLAFHSEEDGNT